MRHCVEVHSGSGESQRYIRQSSAAQRSAARSSTHMASDKARMVLSSIALIGRPVCVHENCDTAVLQVQRAISKLLRAGCMTLRSFGRCSARWPGAAQGAAALAWPLQQPFSLPACSQYPANILLCAITSTMPLINESYDSLPCTSIVPAFLVLLASSAPAQTGLVDNICRPRRLTRCRRRHAP